MYNLSELHVSSNLFFSPIRFKFKCASKFVSETVQKKEEKNETCIKLNNFMALVTWRWRA